MRSYCEIMSEPIGTFRGPYDSEYLALLGCNQCGPYYESFWYFSRLLGADYSNAFCANQSNTLKTFDEVYADLMAQALADARVKNRGNSNNQQVVSVDYVVHNLGPFNDCPNYFRLEAVGYYWRHGY